MSTATTAAFATTHFLLASAPATTILPLLLHEQQSSDAVRSIFSGNLYHTQPADELLHGHGVEVCEHLDRDPNLPQLFLDHTQDLPHHTTILYPLAELTQAG
jgi:hypothetical protein